MAMAEIGDLWRCGCGETWIEDGEGAQNLPAQCGRCGRDMVPERERRDRGPGGQEGEAGNFPEVWTIYSPAGDGEGGYVAEYGDHVAEHPGAILVPAPWPTDDERTRLREVAQLLTSQGSSAKRERLASWLRSVADRRGAGPPPSPSSRGSS